MSEKTVVSIEPGLGGEVAVKLLKAPMPIDGALDPVLFDCSPGSMPDWGSSEAVKEHGNLLLEKLRGHPAVSTALDRARQAPNGEVHSIYFQLAVPDVEGLCWEALCDDAGTFLALDRGLAIGRIAHSVVDRAPSVHGYAAPLRLLVILGALGVDAGPEWRELVAAVTRARQDGLEVSVKVLSGQRELVLSLRDAGFHWLEAEPTPQRSSDFENILNDYAPQVIHFFCHGNASHGVSWLEIGTVNDFDAIPPSQNGSLKLNTQQLAQIEGMQEAWLVVLNCCLGGQASEDSHSMAHQLVAAGVPAAVGMLERVDAGDACEFAGGFMASFLKYFRRRANGSSQGNDLSLEWAEVLRSPRQDLCERHGNDPENRRQWLLPVLYVRPEGFRFRPVNDSMSDRVLTDFQQRAALVAGMLRDLPPNAPPEVRDQFLALLDDLPPELRPDLFGRFLHA